MSKVKTLLREPYIHFILMGSVLYLFYTILTSQNNLNDKQSIVIGLVEKESIKRDFNAIHKRNVRPAELALMVEYHFFDEVLLYESERVGISRTDKEIRKRLLFKMKYILASSANFDEPSEKELYVYYQKNIDEYSEVKQLSFSHIYFQSFDENNLEKILRQLNRSNIKPIHAKNYGDIFYQGNHINSVTKEELSKIFGKYFSRKVLQIRKGIWHTPIRSKEGMHMVFIREKVIGEAYTFDEIESMVYEDYLKERKNRVVQETYEKLLTQYALESK